MKAKISVVVGIYNVAQYLPRCIESVLSQTLGFDAVQLILCDDCSTDGSYELCRQYAAAHPQNITVLQTPKNSGACGAPRNIGIAAATAPYLFFLDGDDWLYPNALKALYEAAEQSGADLVQGSYSNDYADGRCLPAAASVERAGIAAGSYDFTQDAPALFLACTCPVWDKLYRTAPYHTHALRFSEGDLGEDMVAPNLYNLLSQSVVIIDEPITHYNRRSDSITAGTTDDTVWMRLHAAHRLLAEDAERLGLSERCCRLCLPAAMLERYPLRMVSECSVQQACDIYLKFKDAFLWAYAHKQKPMPPEAELLFHTAATAADEDVFFLIEQLHRMHGERQLELHNIFTSATWKAAALLQKLLFWKKQ